MCDLLALKLCVEDDSPLTSTSDQMMFIPSPVCAGPVWGKLQRWPVCSAAVTWPWLCKVSHVTPDRGSYCSVHSLFTSPPSHYCRWRSQHAHLRRASCRRLLLLVYTWWTQMKRFKHLFIRFIFISNHLPSKQQQITQLHFMLRFSELLVSKLFQTSWSKFYFLCVFLWFIVLELVWFHS